MSSKPVLIVMGLNSTPLENGLEDVKNRMRQVGAAAKEMGESTRSSSMASSAAIRVLEGNVTNNIRAAERFIATIRPLAGLLEAAFPVIGAVALLGVIGEMATRVTAFAKKVNEIPPNPFAALISSGKLANEELQISNDRLEMEIQKLEHKPVNHMAMALDQVRESSDKMFKSLLKSNEEFDQAMAKNRIGTVKGLWKNMEPTDAANADITTARSGVQAVMADHQSTIDDAIASGNQENVRQAREALMVDLQKAYAQQDQRLRAGLAAAQAKQAGFLGAYSVGANQSNVIQSYQGALAQSANEQTEAGANYGHLILQRKKDALEDANTNGDALKRAQEAMLQQWHKDLDTLKAIYGDDLAMEAHFWEQRAMLTKNGGLATAGALDEANKTIARIRTENIKAAQEFDALSGGSAMDHPDDTEAQSKARLQASQYLRNSGNQLNDAAEANQGREAVEYLKNLNEGITLQRANASAIAEASLRMAEMTGQMSRLDVAQAMAALHTQQYKDETDALAQAMAAAGNLPGGFERSQRIAGLQAQGIQMAGARQNQIMSDQQGIDGQQVGTATKQALDQMVQQWGDMATSLKDIIPQTLNSLNGDLVRLVTGQYKKGDLGHTLTGAGESLVGAALKSGESKLLRAAGLGKRDGSSALSALYVMLAGSTAGLSTSSPSLSGGAGALASLIPGGSFIQRFIGPLLSALPHFAGGGDVAAGYPAMVGERGPEMFVPHTSGRILPAGSFGGGGGDTHIIHVDARGSNDPAAIYAAVQRALPQNVGASMQAVRQRAIRTPQGR